MRNLMTSVCALAAIAACAPEPEPAVLIERSQVERLLEQSTDLNGRRVMIDGYVHLDNGPTGQGVALVYTLMSRPDGYGDELIRFDAEDGAGPNQIDLPVLATTSFPIQSMGDIKTVDLRNGRFRDGSDVPYPLREKVRVTGLVRSGGRTEKGYRPRLVDVTLERAP